jgi:hypothetical protein
MENSTDSLFSKDIEDIDSSKNDLKVEGMIKLEDPQIRFKQNQEFDDKQVYAEQYQELDENQVYSVCPTETTVTAEYTMKIDQKDLFTTTNTLVSLPFGPIGWQWQIVIYPQGVGEAKNSFMSAFLKPIKNDLELADESWARQIDYFQFKVRTSQDFILYQSEQDFNCFSEKQNGWGFEQFIPLDTLRDRIVIDQIVYIVIRVVGPTVSNAATLKYRETIKLSFLDNLIWSCPFGVDSINWKIKFSIHNENGHSYIAAYLVPILSDYENERIICSFILKLFINDQMVTQKCITNNMKLGAGTYKCGWNKLIDQAKVIDLVTFEAVVIWDPSTLKKARNMMNSKLVNRKGLEEKVKILQSELEFSYKKIYELETFSNQDLNNQGLQELYNCRERVKLLTAELNEFRTLNNNCQVQNVKLAAVKERLSRLKLFLEGVEINDKFNDRENVPLDTLHLEYARVLHEKAELELKFAQCKSELDFVNRSRKDGVLMSAIPHHDEVNSLNSFELVHPEDKFLHAIQTAVNETLVGKTAIEEISAKLTSEMTSFQKAALLADIGVVQCGLDVANATILEIDISSLKEVEQDEYYNALNGLTLTRQQLMILLFELESPDMFFRLCESKGFNISASTPKLPPPTGVISHRVPRKRSTTEMIPELEQFRQVNRKIDLLMEIIQSEPNSCFSPKLVQEHEEEIEDWPEEKLVINHNDINVTLDFI